MVNTKFKFIASQARTINLYRNTGSKLLKCNANIYFSSPNSTLSTKYKVCLTDKDNFIESVNTLGW